MAVFEGEKLLSEIVNNGRMSDDEVVASDVPPRYLLSSYHRDLILSFCPLVFSLRGVRIDRTIFVGHIFLSPPVFLVIV